MGELTAELKEALAEAVRQEPMPIHIPGPWVAHPAGWMFRIVGLKKDGARVVELAPYMVVSMQRSPHASGLAPGEGGSDDQTRPRS